MCGIGSITIGDKCTGSYDLQKGAEALLTELDSRGRDACGIMAITPDGAIQVQKAAVRASSFIFGIADIPAETVAVAVHTRLATKGKPEWGMNNHPVMAGEALIMHNGVVDDSEVPRSKGHPVVDTYALSHALWTVRERNQGETNRQYAKRVALALAACDGSAAVQAAIQGTPMLLSVRLHGSPLWYAEADGVRITASTRRAVELAADAIELDLPTERRIVTTKQGKGKEVTRTEYYEKIQEAKEGRVLSWQGGAHNMLMIELPERTYKRNWRTGSNVGTHGNYPQGAYQGGYGSYGGNYENRNGYWTVLNGVDTFKYYKKEDEGKTPIPAEPYKWGGNATTTKPTTPTTPAKPKVGVTTKPGEYMEYPPGTPKADSPEGQTLRMMFHFWRTTEHGRKWARTHPQAAHSYDQAVTRTRNHGNPPPFPTPRELEAMEADPLFSKEQKEAKIAEIANPPFPTQQQSGENRSFVGDSCGVVSVADNTELDAALLRYGGIDYDRSLSDIVEQMLKDRGTEHTGQDEWRRCDLCQFECDDVVDTDDGPLCGDCQRIWAWSD